MRKLILSLWVICTIMIGCTTSNSLKSSVNMQFYLVNGETKEEFLIIDISENEFKVFEYDASPEKGQIQKIVPIMENGEQKEVVNNTDKYYKNIFLLMRTHSLVGSEENPYYIKTKDANDNKDYSYELSILNYKNYFRSNLGLSPIDEVFHNKRDIRIISNQIDNESPNTPLEKEKFTYNNKKFRELWENKGNGFELVEHVDFSE